MHCKQLTFVEEWKTNNQKENSRHLCTFTVFLHHRHHWSEKTKKKNELCARMSMYVCPTKSTQDKFSFEKFCYWLFEKSLFLNYQLLNIFFSLCITCDYRELKLQFLGKNVNALVNKNQFSEWTKKFLYICSMLFFFCLSIKHSISFVRNVSIASIENRVTKRTLMNFN